MATSYPSQIDKGERVDQAENTKPRKQREVKQVQKANQEQTNQEPHHGKQIGSQMMKYKQKMGKTSSIEEHMRKGREDSKF